jgi:ABC-2 type transport system ATP-binding protein
MDTTVLQLEHVKKNFGKFQALKDVTFSIHTGEVMGFIGPNGAGKSTTIRILLGMLKKSAGTATIFGKDVWTDDMVIHKRISYIPGDVYLWPNLTGGEIIDLLLRLNGQERNAKTTQLIQKFQLDPKKKARTYSKGNRQKIALIAALSQSADLYIFDEPTSGLDPLNELTFQQEVLALKKEGKSILLSSHILSEVEKMCDKIAIIRDGTIIETGDLNQMRHLTSVELQVEVTQNLADLAKMTGVKSFKFADDTLKKAVFSVERDHLGTVMAQLATKGITNLTSTSPTLEDLFMGYYKEQGVDSHDQ